MEESSNKSHHEPWNKGKLVGQKAPFKLKDIWAIRVRLQLEHRVRELAMFDLGLDSKLRACDLVKLKVRDICHGDRGGSPRHHHAAKNRPAGAIRDYRANTGSGKYLDQGCRTAIRRLPVPKSNTPFPASRNPSVRSDRR